MKKQTPLIFLLAVLLVCLLTVLVLTYRSDSSPVRTPLSAATPVPPAPDADDPEAAADLAEQIQPDQNAYPEVMIPAQTTAGQAASEHVAVNAGEVYYAYEGMQVDNYGGTVYNTGAEVRNYGGTVYSNSGMVINNGGVVYAKGGTVQSSSGTVYCGSEDVQILALESSYESRVSAYHELKLAGYYEPYITLEGVTTEPGSESMIITEDAVCRITPKSGYRITGADSTSGKLVFKDDGSVSLMNVTDSTTLRLEIEPVP